MGVMKRKYNMLVALVLMWVISPNVLAQVNTAESTLGNFEDWVMGWIPTAATLGIIGCTLAWMFNMMRLDLFFKVAGGLIVIGSASYLVGLAGLGS